MNQKVSVIIPTYNGAAKLPYLLDALAQQTMPDFEIIIVVDGSTDNTKDILQEYKSRFSALRVIAQQNGGRAGAKNRGAREASGELLVFYDDDMVPSSSSVAQHVDAQRKNNFILAGNPLEEFDRNQTDVQNYKAKLSARWVEKYKEPVTLLTRDNLFFTAANCSVRKSTFEKLKGFDDRLTDAEDFNFAIRALAAGEQVCFDKENKAIHRDFISARSYVCRLRAYRAAHQKIKSLYPDEQPSKPNTSAYKHWIYWFFASPFWLDRIDNENFLVLPELIRYKLYDIIFQALGVEYPDTKL